ncbi:MAG TPA: haloalkane dehalogenase [Gammaproteobacteria bacterium]|nr:haloalkane dehalogenase [Gammaproteobacteria bacterium]
MSVQSKTVSVHGSTMHYLSEGKGKPIVFLHGAPASSYLWRNILPKLGIKGHCIAPDFIGMGNSDKPDIQYTIHDHIKYFEGFIDALKLKDITLVMLGMGSVVGMVYAEKHPENISGLVFIESFLHVPKDEQEIPMLIQDLIPMMKDEKRLKEMVVDENYALEKFLPSLTLKKLSPEILAVYRKPFETKESRVVLWQSVLENPFFNSKSPLIPIINGYLRWLQTTHIPKLLLYVVPGFLVSIETVKWCTDNIPALTAVDIGFGLHYLPETIPDEISDALLAWMPS